VIRPVPKRQFGVSTHLYHGQRLCRDHLLEIAAHGFEWIEVYATRTHFDYHSQAAVADLQQWLAEAGLQLRSIHAPTAESFMDGRWGGTLSLASTDPDARAHAVSETERALHIARRIPAAVLVAHLGVPRTQRGDTRVAPYRVGVDSPRAGVWADPRVLPAGAAADPAPDGVGAAPRRGAGFDRVVGADPRVRPVGDSRAAARHSIEALQRIAQPLGVQIAVEVIPNDLSRAGSIAHFVEDDLDGVGICLDFGHAHLDGDVIDAVETVSEHLIATHVHDNRGRSDDHLLPFDGTIDWAATLLAVQKIGYDGPFMFEIVAQGSTRETLARARNARQRIDAIMAEG
jgi:sugar phosphate isomerase/epimerase